METENINLWEFSPIVVSLAKTLKIQLTIKAIPNLFLDLLNLLESKPDDPYEREIEIVRYFNADDRPFLAVFKAGITQLSAHLGQAYYIGDGERYGPMVDYRGAYYQSAEQAIEIALWQRDTEAIALMLTGHDADSLLTLTLGLDRSPSSNPL